MKKIQEAVVVLVVGGAIALSVGWWIWNEGSPQPQDQFTSHGPVVKPGIFPAPIPVSPPHVVQREHEGNEETLQPVAWAPESLSQKLIPAMPAPALPRSGPVAAVPERKIETPRIRTLVTNTLSRIRLAPGQILVYWDRENEFGAVRVDRLTEEHGADYTWWRLPESARSAGTFAAAVEQKGHVDEEQSAMRCGGTLFLWSENAGVRVPDGYCVTIVTNGNIGEVDLLSLKWKAAPFRE